MRVWPWHKRATERTLPPAPEGVTDLAEARQARLVSEQALRHIQARDPSVREVAARLRELRQTNHFAETLNLAMHRRE